MSNQGTAGILVGVADENLVGSLRFLDLTTFKVNLTCAVFLGKSQSEWDKIKKITFVWVSDERSDDDNDDGDDDDDDDDVDDDDDDDDVDDELVLKNNSINAYFNAVSSN